MTNPSPAPTRRRRLPLWLILAIVCFALLIIVASGTAFITSWAVWLAAGLIAICLHLWFVTEL
jgi:fatty acid desaturase